MLWELLTLGDFMIVYCDLCGKEFECSPSRYNNNKTHCCSKECSRILAKKNRENDPAYLNCTCAVCGKKFHRKQFHINRFNTICCSKECGKKIRSDRMIGEKNHQYGLKGNMNSSWVSDRRISPYGYIMIRSINHPFRNSDDFVFEHRLVAEEYLLTDENSVEVDGKMYLKEEYVVHHKDGNKQNNDVSNLVVMTKGEHSRLHNQTTQRDRDSNGRFI